ncbi:hypothetical protein [Vitiosangium sp. GDMCC 1.1324]|uniref:hypothetical protein n=1 Tax=Vitiosangium sp. (strain GDMCC 1.1324) TaxID=2138576 RepID=UPI0011B54ED9|nr:hypothetical protein [Vitiosangium sp. GDMCC 1.1324]
MPWRSVAATLLFLMMNAPLANAQGDDEDAKAGLKPGLSKYYRGRCTHQGQVSAPCFDFYVNVVEKKNFLSDEENKVSNCFDRLGSKSLGLAQEAATELFASDATSAYAQECYRLVTLLAGEEWKAKAEKARRAAKGWDPRFERSSAELEASITTETKGFHPEGAPVRGRLEAFEPLEFPVKAGHCYMAVLRLDPDAGFSDHARKGVTFTFDMGGTPTVGGPGIVGPGGSGSAGCPTKAGRGSLDLQANFGSAFSSKRIHDLGQGGFAVQFYAKELNAKERAERAKIERDAEEEARRMYESSQREAKKTCEQCKGKRYACEERRGRINEFACRQEYLVCIERKGVSEADCE